MKHKRPSFFLVSPYADITAPGVRILSAVLRQAGYRVRSVFLQDITLLPERKFHPDFTWQYSQQVLDKVAELANGFDVAGISLMTNYFNHAVQVTDFLHKQLDIPIIWGGVHPTVRPDECLEFADMICVGEGEEAMLEVMERIGNDQNLSGIRNLWIKGEDRPELRPLISDLDSLPLSDFNLDDQYVLLPDGETIQPLDMDTFVYYASSGVMWNDKMSYQVITSRGCPYGCTFCINSYLRGLYKGQKTYRRRSFDNVFQELQFAVDRFPVNEILFSDDSFFASSEDDLEAFAKEYKKRFGLGFRCMATPNAITERKVNALVDAGLCYVEVGIQSCAPETLALYKRKWGDVEHVKNAAKILTKYSDQLDVLYDIIIDNPWESVEHNLQTLRAIVELPRPYLLQMFSLTLFPGTELYDRGVVEGIINDVQSDVYQKHYQNRELTYLNVVLSFIHRQFPRWMLRFMLSNIMVSVFQRDYMKPIYRTIYEFARLLRTLKRRAFSRSGAVSENPIGKVA